MNELKIKFYFKRYIEKLNKANAEILDLRKENENLKKELEALKSKKIIRLIEC